MSLFIDVVGDGKITKNDLKLMAVRKMRKVHNKLALSVYKVDMLRVVWSTCLTASNLSRNSFSSRVNCRRRTIIEDQYSQQLLRP